ncbi:MAG: mannitol dehydrogenase family protein [Henriciella sp.]|nr:mannitol dehydrogenase family protein [Henriciella sp.]
MIRSDLTETMERLHPGLLGAMEPALSPPLYDRSGRSKVVHIGVGAFHRAHQAFYFDRLLRAGQRGWTIVGASLRTPKSGNQLNPQSGLYTLKEIDGENTKHTVIGSVREVIDAFENADKLIEAIASPSTQLVTLTITEKGYCLDPSKGELNLDHPDVRRDLDNPKHPVSAPGFLVAGLAKRKASNGPGLTILSCDNLPGNGELTERAILSFAEKLDSKLVDWIEANVSFPSSMVDRITPATPPAALETLSSEFGILDEALVETEPFHQWVIEDWFAGERPPLDQVGVQFTDNVAGWEKAKLRMLNGAHSAIAYLGGLSELNFVHNVVNAPPFENYINHLWNELETTVPLIEGFEPANYRRDLLGRFSNRALRHQIYQIAMDGSQKLPQRLIEPFVERLANARQSPAIALAIAAWMRWQFAQTLNGTAYEVQDPLASELSQIVSYPETDAQAIVSGFTKTAVFAGIGQAHVDTFVEHVTLALKHIMGHPAIHTQADIAQLLQFRF